MVAICCYVSYTQGIYDSHQFSRNHAPRKISLYMIHSSLLAIIIATSHKFNFHYCSRI